MRRALLILFAIAVFLLFVAIRMVTVSVGTGIELEAFPADPGTLSYAISDVSGIDTQPGETVYAILAPGPLQWEAVLYTTVRPVVGIDEVCIRGTLRSAFEGDLRATWGIERIAGPPALLEALKDAGEDEIRASVLVDDLCNPFLHAVTIGDETYATET